MKSSKESDPTKYDYGPKGANFTEQYQWRDAASGKLLAASDYYPPKAEASQTPPGYGGLIYGLTNNGKLLTLYVQPKE
jgi:UDP-N-acetylglucosamine pyrophosphorylase